jgi:hypothetical protein
LISTQVRVELRYHPSYSGQYATARRHFKDEFAAVVVHRTRKHVIPLGGSVEKWSSHCGGGGGAAAAGSRNEARHTSFLEAARTVDLSDKTPDDALSAFIDLHESKYGKAQHGQYVNVAEALNVLGVQRKGGKRWDKRYVREHHLSLQSKQTPLTEDEKRRIVVLEEKFRSMWGKWPKIARLLGNGRTAADWNRVKCYWRDTGQDRPWSCCDKCEQWRLREKGTVVVDGAYWTCADGGRKCTEPCDSVLPELVEAFLEAP